MIDQLNYNQIKILIKILCQLLENDSTFIKNKYLTQADNFDGTLAFLMEIKLLTLQNGKIEPNILIKKSFTDNKIDDAFLKNILLNAILTKNNLFSRQIYDYLNNFRLQNGCYEYKPTTDKRLKDSAIRNLLIELNYIYYDTAENLYKIHNQYTSDFNKTIFEHKNTLTHQSFSLILKKQEILGLKAEKLVMLYEQIRLKPYLDLVQSIEHTSRSEVGAGFDIKSWEYYLEKKEPEHRYIEVKAVSPLDYKFYWSKNEIETARIYKNQYYLYLVPVVKHDELDINQLMVIPDPYVKVFNDDLWNKKIEGYCVFKK